MALRGSAKNAGKEINLRVVLGEHAEDSGIKHARALVDFAEAFMMRDEEILARDRTALVNEMGVEAMVDAAAVAANFQRMVRIADATGIPVDSQMNRMTRDIQEELGLRRYPSARNTPRAD